MTILIIGISIMLILLDTFTPNSYQINIMSKKNFIPLNIAVLTISDSRTAVDDISGKTLYNLIQDAGHTTLDQKIIADNIYKIRAIISQWLITPEIHVIITTGGTGVTGRDGTPEAITPLLDKTLSGFGEIFRMLSYEEIKTSAIQSRAIAGVANGTYIFCLPGSASACRDAWNFIIQDQLDHRNKPCNLVQLIPRLMEQ